MQTAQCRNRAIEASIFTGFGALWLVLGLYLRQQLNAASLAWIAGAALLLWSACSHVLLRIERPAASPDDIKRSRIFHCINAGQWIAVFLVLTVLRIVHHELYGVTAIAAIVGLHLFPLARLFRNPFNYATGSLLVAWAACAAIFVSIDSLQSTTALGTGVILWLSAVVTLAFATYSMRARFTLHKRPRVA